MKLYALINENDKTFWQSFKTNKDSIYAIPEKMRTKNLSQDGIFKVYKNVATALLLYPLQRRIYAGQPINEHLSIYEAEGDIVKKNWAAVGTWELKIKRKIIKPRWYHDIKKRTQIQIRFATLCGRAILFYFADRYPEDNRPLKSIELAEKFLQQSRSYSGKPDINILSNASYVASEAEQAGNDAVADACRSEYNTFNYPYAGYEVPYAAWVASYPARMVEHTASSDQFDTCNNEIFAALSASDAINAIEIAKHKTHLNSLLNISKLANKAVEIEMK